MKKEPDLAVFKIGSKPLPLPPSANAATRATSPPSCSVYLSLFGFRGFVFVQQDDVLLETVPTIAKRVTCGIGNSSYDSKKRGMCCWRQFQRQQKAWHVLLETVPRTAKSVACAVGDSSKDSKRCDMWCWRQFQRQLKVWHVVLKTDPTTEKSVACGVGDSSNGSKKHVVFETVPTTAKSVACDVGNSSHDNKKCGV
jgi:hypothetical protein